MELCLVLLLLAPLVQTTSLENTGLVVLALKQHFHLGCVFVATGFGSNFQETKELWKLQVFLSARGVPLAAIPLSHSMPVQMCRYNRPLYVLLTSTRDVYEYLAQEYEYSEKNKNILAQYYDQQKTQSDQLFKYCVIENFAIKKTLRLELLYKKFKAELSAAIWLLVAHSQSSMDDFLQELAVPMDCLFLVAEQQSAQRILLTEVYHVAAGLPPHADTFGIWTLESGLHTKGLSMYERRTDLRGMRLRVTAIHVPPASVLNPSLPVAVTGYCGTVWEMLERRLNFTSEVIQPARNTWGVQTAEGAWNGMVGLLVDGQAEVAVSSISSTLARHKAVDFTTHIYSATFRVFIRQPDHLDVKFSVLAAPFSPRFWTAMVGAASLIAVLLKPIQSYGVRLGAGESVVQWQCCSLADTLFFVTSAFFCLQGQDTTPGSIRGRVVLLVTYVTGMVLLAVYSAALVSFLSVQRFSMPFTNMQELLDDTKYQLGVMKKSAAQTMLNDSKELLLRKMFVKLSSSNMDNFPPTPLEGLQRVCASDYYAFIPTYEVAMGLVGSVNCSLATMQQHFYKVTVSMATRKNSSLLGIINYNLLRLRDGGLLERVHKATWPQVTHTAPEPTLSVTFKDVTPFMMVLTLGVAAATGLLLLEAFTRKCHHCFKLT